MKNYTGITLIALIITIIIMLIIAGVTFKILVNTGLFNNAQKATDGTKVDVLKEELTNVAMGTIKANGKIDKDELESKLKEKFPNNSVYKLDKGLKITIDEKDYIINDKAEVEEAKGYTVINGLAYVLKREDSAQVYGNRGEVSYYWPAVVLEIQPVTSGKVQIIDSVIIDCKQYTVKQIAQNAFSSANGSADELEEITIPNSITKIGKNAFLGCHSLTNIIIPETVEEMEENVFEFWTEDQTIKVYWNQGEKPEGWSENWNANCSAKILYGYTE